MAEQEHHHDDHEHDHPLMPHVWNLLALFALTGVTYGVALVHLGPLADLVALAIAGLKATLVIMIFMHVKGSSRLIKVTAVSGFFWIFLFFAYLVGDVLTRPGDTVYEGWQSDVRKELKVGHHHHGHGHSEGHGSEGHGDKGHSGDH